METKSIQNNLSLTNVQTSKTDKTKNAEAIKKAKAQHEAKLAKTSYDVSVSSRAKEMAEAYKKAHQIARNTPDVREDRVAELKTKIKEGKYQVNAENIANGMTKEAIKDRIALEMHKEAQRRKPQR